MKILSEIQFLLGDEHRRLSNIRPTQTILEYLRTVERMTGTKEGCAEGDCGACTVVLAELREDKLCYSAINSCITFVPMLHGKQLITVQHLRRSDGSLHPVQQAMVDEHGSQCGFCTPGFVMSLFAMYRNQCATDRTTIDDALAGNLCRCTGYIPIVRAAEKSLSAITSDQFDQNQTNTIAQLKQINQAALTYDKDGMEFHVPTTRSQLLQILSSRPNAYVVAGATDVGLWVTKQRRKLNPLVFIGGINDLRKIELVHEHLQIGAAVTVSEAIPLLTNIYPQLEELLRRFGSEQIRNLATIGGNIANGSPIGDSMPALIAAGTQLQLSSNHGTRSLPIEKFFLDYGKQDLRSGELLDRIDVPVPKASDVFRTYKISKRFHQDISAVCGAFFARIENGVITKVRVAYGGMASTPRRAYTCEGLLVNQSFDQTSISRAMAGLQEDFSPISDFRATDAYRMQVAKNLLLRFFYEVSTESNCRIWSEQIA